MGTYLTGTATGYGARLRELVDDDFDVVHFHNPSLLGGPGALKLGSALKLYTAHEHWLLCPTHVLFRYGREVCTRRTCWRCTLHYQRPPQLWRSFGLMERSLQHIDLLICPSAFTARLHQESLDLPTVVLPPFFSPEPEELADVPDPEPRRRPYFLYVGRLEPIKGVDRLFRAFRSVRGADLLAVGGGSLEEPLRRLAAETDNITLCGARPLRDVLSLCSGALAVVLPSAGYETFGGSAVESMAMGTPVLVRALGPLPELVSDGGGWVFSDDADLSRQLQELADHPERAEEEGRRAEAVFAKRWALPQLIDRHLDQIADAAARTGRTGLAARAAAAARAECRPHEQFP
jgi:glycosyltransferase involved in cell wall biosynthesis